MYIHNILQKVDGKPADMLLTNCKITTMTGNEPYGLVENSAIAIADKQIVWVGNDDNIPEAYKGYATEDLDGALVTPGLIDCHSHVVFGGNRAKEFELRLEGASYEEIARAGGGIVATVEQTRKATFDSLLADALKRVDALIAEGVTSLEIKSGYGLDVETELKMLRVARQIQKERRITIRTSFLGAHAVPGPHKEKADSYIDDICIPALERAHAEGLVDAVDGFCEGIAFSPDQIARVFEKAEKLDLPVKLHAEQLSNLGGTKLAVKYGALSADHLEYLDEDGVKAMAQAGSVAVLLPGAFYTLRESQVPPVDWFRKFGIAMAVASDCNPGSSPLASILLSMNMACTLFRMTPEETLKGITKNAAKALGFKDRGTVEAGKRADLCVWDVKEPAELSYRIGFNPLKTRIFAGEVQ